jgi:signal transduction histidine kinase
MPNSINISPIARRRWIFLAFLVALHLVFLLGPVTPYARLLFLSHIGIGLLWQPFVQPRRRVGFGGTLLVVVSAALLAYFLSWGLLVFWTMLLFGVAGGKVFLFPDARERLFHLLALGYLATALLALILPESLAVLRLADSLLSNLVLYLAPAVFIVMAALPVKQGVMEDRAEIVDYVYGVLVLLLLAVIVLGSVSFSLLFKASYFEALLVTLALVAGVLLLLGLIWDPRAGFAGLGSAVAQHVMSLGLPFEGWLESLAVLAKREEDPEQFLLQACVDLPERLPGVVGGEWQTRTGARHSFGQQQGQRASFAHGELEVGLMCRVHPSPTLLWHYDLAVRILAEFYSGKWRAQALQRLSYIEAIHETGARLTHDVKNLLQVLDTLCVAAEQEGGTPSPRFSQLLRRQLPEIATRLRQTLTKLSSPGTTAIAQPLPAAAWLTALENRYPGGWIEFSLGGGDQSAVMVPDAGLFSSIAENLLQNIVDKRRNNPDIRAKVCLHGEPGRVWLEVSDDGAAIAPSLAAGLFRQRVSSENGLGIGLFQSARLAEQSGMHLNLAENRDGCVCFRLTPAAA